MGLRAKEIGALWKCLVAHDDDPSPRPGFETAPAVGFTAAMAGNSRRRQDRRHAIPDHRSGTATLMKSFGEIDRSRRPHRLQTRRVRHQARTTLDVSSTLLPGWVSSLSPASFDLSLRLTGEDWDKAARIALDDPHFGRSGDLSPETSDQITQILMAGHPKIVLTPGHLKIQALNLLAFEGESLRRGGRADRAFSISPPTAWIGR